MNDLKEFKVVELVSETTLDPAVGGEWYSNHEIPVRDPILMTISNEKDMVDIYSYFLYPLKNVLVVLTDGTNDMPIYQINELKPFTHVKLSVPIVQYTSISKTFTFDKAKYKLHINNEKYEELKKNDVCWRVKLQNTYYFPKSGKPHISQNDAKNLLINITTLANILTSEAFRTICFNYKEATGSTFDRLPWRYDNYSNGHNGEKGVFKCNEDEEKRCFDFNKHPEHEKEFFGYLGVRNNTYGGFYKRRVFTLGCMANDSKGVGQGQTLGWNWVVNAMGAGMAWYPRQVYNSPSKQLIMHQSWIHDMGHVFGFTHYSCFCVGPLAENNPCVITTLGDIFGSDLTYYDLMTDSPKTRCGYNSLELWMIKNADKFDPKYIERLTSKKNERNAALQNIININNQLNRVPVLLRGLAAKTYNLTGNLNKFDKQLYENYGNLNYYKKLD